MQPTHHPGAQVLANFLIGDCSPGEALLVSRHLDFCPHCVSRVQAMGAMPGRPGEITFDEPHMLRPGVELTPLHDASGLGEAVYQLRIAPGEQAPLDEPLEAAEILLLEGRLAAGGKRYRPGDFLAASEVTSALVADPTTGCVCLVTAHDPAGTSREGFVQL